MPVCHSTKQSHLEFFFKLSSQRKIQRRGTFNLDSEKMDTDFLNLRDM